MSRLFGKAAGEAGLSRDEIHEICASALAELPIDGKRVLVLIPDHTRHAPIDVFFHVLSELLHERVRALDFLVATGTHAPMADAHLYQHLGLTPAEHARRFSKVHLFNHDHKDRDALVSLGELGAGEVSRLTNGLFSRPVPITINSMATAYDHILIVSPVVPHEAMGFAGGNKYFFPGIAGLEVVETFHWLAAVITNPVVNGVKDTPTRRVIDRAVSFLRTPRTCFAFAVDARHRLACLFAGTPEEAWSRAADHSARLHVKYVDRAYARVLALTPPIYEELWVAGKAMYKLEPVVADGGELIIHGPHIRRVSFVHEEAITRIGYHVLDYFLKQWNRFAGEPKLILAHLTNVKGTGTFEGGFERPRVDVVLATGIGRDTCEQINLPYTDVQAIDVEAYRNDPDTLVVEEAGQILYRRGDTRRDHGVSAAREED